MARAAQILSRVLRFLRLLKSIPGMARTSAPLWGSGHEVEAEINSDGLCLALEWSRDNTHVNVNEIQF